jgi:hypothetical protein
VPSVTWAGGGWVYQKGSGFLKVNEYVIRSDQFFNPEGEIIDITTVSFYSSNIYAEYGFTDRLTGVLYFPFFVRTTLNKTQFRQSGNELPGDEENNIGDIEVGFKYGFAQDKPVVFSAGIYFGIPSGEDVGGEGGILQTGDGEFNQLFKFEASRSFYPIPLYATATIGFNNRTRGFSEEFHFGLEAGYNISPKFLATVKMYGVESFKNGDPGGSAGNGIFSNNTEYLSIRPGLAYTLKENWGISAEVGFATRGERILASPSYELGVFYTF